MLAELFGYDKYHEVTRELCIRGTFCDLATRIEGKFQMIIEVKAIGLDRFSARRVVVSLRDEDRVRGFPQRIGVSP